MTQKVVLMLCFTEDLLAIWQSRSSSIYNIDWNSSHKSIGEGGLTDDQVIKSAKKNLKRKLENMLNRFTYINVSNKSYVFPQTLLLEEIFSTYVEMKNELENMRVVSDKSKCIAQ